MLHFLLPPVLPPVPVIYSFVTNYPQLNGLKQRHLFCSSICGFSRHSADSSSLLRPVSASTAEGPPHVWGFTRAIGWGRGRSPYTWLLHVATGLLPSTVAGSEREHSKLGGGGWLVPFMTSQYHRPSDALGGNADTSGEKCQWLTGRWVRGMAYVHTAILGRTIFHVLLLDCRAHEDRQQWWC